MRQGFVKAAAVTPKIKVADTKYNAELILDMMKESTRQGAKIVVFPELCLTGYTCQDLFLQERLLQGAKDALMKLVKESASLDAIFFVGLPFEILGKLYNVAAVHRDVPHQSPNTGCHVQNAWIPQESVRFPQ